MDGAETSDDVAGWQAYVALQHTTGASDAENNKVENTETAENVVERHTYVALAESTSKEEKLAGFSIPTSERVKEQKEEIGQEVQWVPDHLNLSCGMLLQEECEVLKEWYRMRFLKRDNANNIEEKEQINVDTWRRVTDKSTGRTYYYDRRTRKPTWTKPGTGLRESKKPVNQSIELIIKDYEEEQDCEKDLEDVDLGLEDVDLDPSDNVHDEQGKLSNWCPFPKNILSLIEISPTEDCGFGEEDDGCKRTMNSEDTMKATNVEAATLGTDTDSSIATDTNGKSTTDDTGGKCCIQLNKHGRSREKYKVLDVLEIDHEKESLLDRVLVVENSPMNRDFLSKLAIDTGDADGDAKTEGVKNKDGVSLSVLAPGIDGVVMIVDDCLDHSNKIPEPVDDRSNKIPEPVDDSVKSIDGGLHRANKIPEFVEVEQRSAETRTCNVFRRRVEL